MSIETENSRIMDDLKSGIGEALKSKPTEPSRRKLDAAERLRGLAKLRDERKALYGDNYIRAGFAMAFMLGTVTLRTPRDYIRFGLIAHQYSKMSRYSIQWKDGHPDSLDDLSVYSQILATVDDMDDQDLSDYAAKMLWENK